MTVFIPLFDSICDKVLATEDAEGIKQEMEKMRESSEWAQALAEYVPNTRNLEHNSELVASDVDVNDLNSDIT